MRKKEREKKEESVKWEEEKKWERLKVMRPEPLSGEKLEKELGERRARKNNVRVHCSDKEDEDVAGIIKRVGERTGVKISEEMIDNKWRGEFRVIFKNVEEREYAMQKKSEIKGLSIWMERDLT